MFAIRYVYQIKQPLKKNIGKEYLAYKGLDELEQTNLKMSEKGSSFFLFKATFRKTMVFQDDQRLLEVKSDEHQLNLVTLIGD